LTSGSLGDIFSGSESHNSCTEGMCRFCTHSPYVIAHDEFTWPSPALALQERNAGVRRPGYEANL